MGLRFRKSLRISPGVRLNLSKSGVSWSLGRRGAVVNVGSKGARATVGLPGTGISYSRRLGVGRRGKPGHVGLGLVVFVLLVIWIWHAV